MSASRRRDNAPHEAEVCTPRRTMSSSPAAPPEKTPGRPEYSCAPSEGRDGQRPGLADTRHCPLCGGPNACALAAGATADVVCWCAQEHFPPSLLQRLPVETRGRACICRRCAQAAAEPEPSRSGAP